MTEGNTSKPLKIIICGDTFPPDVNGAARFAERLAGGLIRRGHEVQIIAPAYSSSHGTFREVHDGVELTVHRVRSHKLISHATLRIVMPFGLTRKFAKILEDFKPDAIHSQSHLVIGRFVTKAARAKGIRVLATNHIMPENLVKYSMIVPRWLEGFAMAWSWRDAGKVLRQAEVVTTPTRRAAELLEEATGMKGILAISCGIDASKYANSNPPQNRRPRILYLGRLDYEKHIHNLLKAVALLPKDLNTIVELVGEGSERNRLESLAFELGIRKNVIFAGHISEAELPLAYERATVFAMPSIAELQSIATMEAMASGRPIVAANAMALPHLVHDGDNGYLFEPDDIEMFADRLKRVLTASPDELERLSDNSLHLIGAHDINRTLTIFEGLYRGDREELQTSDDNRESYNLPIGRLNESLREQIHLLRKRTSELRERTSEMRNRFTEFGDGVSDRIEYIREDVSERAKAVDKRVRSTVKKARNRIKSQGD